MPCCIPGCQLRHKFGAGRAAPPAVQSAPRSAPAIAPAPVPQFSLSLTPTITHSFLSAPSFSGGFSTSASVDQHQRHANTAMEIDTRSSSLPVTADGSSSTPLSLLPTDAGALKDLAADQTSSQTAPVAHAVREPADDVPAARASASSITPLTAGADHQQLKQPAGLGPPQSTPTADDVPASSDSKASSKASIALASAAEVGVDSSGLRCIPLCLRCLLQNQHIRPMHSNRHSLRHSPLLPIL